MQDDGHLGFHSLVWLKTIYNTPLLWSYGQSLAPASSASEYSSLFWQHQARGHAPYCSAVTAVTPADGTSLNSTPFPQPRQQQAAPTASEKGRRDNLLGIGWDRREPLNQHSVLLYTAQRGSCLHVHETFWSKTNRVRQEQRFAGSPLLTAALISRFQRHRTPLISSFQSHACLFLGTFSSRHRRTLKPLKPDLGGNCSFGFRSWRLVRVLSKRGHR